MSELVRQVWQAVRPVTAQQRFLWWCGTLMLASGAVHGVVALVDWAPWYGAVSWRKPTVFGMSFGILAWSAVWIMRQLPVRRWGWLPVGLLGAGSVAEIAMVTTQRWRGVPSHFNQETGFDAGIWSAMGNIVVLVALAIAILLVWSLVRFEGTTVARIAVVVGLLAIEVSGYIGFGMAAEGEAYVDATGRVPETIVFGAAGSAKLAHAIGMHGLQVLGLLAIGLGMAALPKGTQAKVMAAAVTGYAAVFGAVAATAYAGRPWTSPSAPVAVLGLAGVVALVAVAGFVAARLLGGRGRARAGVVS
ncbi:hypothetical protein [Phytohabitans aurantiacus]|uniref:hypothetical protein n=1 Tax=Phytohabitans aurantiacus TaxID=3016789 RepID=UPI002491F75C|nr:hypothetical protein [Phytohabitans aurantiacus]